MTMKKGKFIVSITFKICKYIFPKNKFFVWPYILLLLSKQYVHVLTLNLESELNLVFFE